MDAKKFYDVFTDIELTGDINTVLKDCMITAVKKDRTTSDGVVICMSFNTLIPKRSIESLEKNISKQFFSGSTAIHINPDFILPDTYNPSNIYDAYLDSILSMMAEKSRYMESVFKRADFIINGKNIKLILEDTIIARELSNDLLDILELVFNKRCHQEVEFSLDYKEKKDSKLLEESEKNINAIVSKILTNNAIAAPVQEGGQANSDKKVKKDAVKIVRPLVRSDREDVLYGKEFEDNAMSIEDIISDIGEVTIKGQILTMEAKPLRNGEKSIVTCNITDFTDTIGFKIFVPIEQEGELSKALKPGTFVKLKGRTEIDKYTHELTIMSITGIMSIPSFITKRMDTAEEKRVELHCHTKMSDFDGVSEVNDIIKQAKAWGHKALAITDHGVVQAFTDAYHLIGDHDPDFKVIYGCEAYIVDDTKEVVTEPKGQKLDGSYVVFDIETTGFNAGKNKIIEIGAVKIIGGEIVDRFSEFINPYVPIPYKITELTSITDEMVKDAPGIDVILPKFMDFCVGSVLVAHNAVFDTSFIKYNCREQGLDYDYTHIDTMILGRYFFPKLGKLTLDNIAKELKISLEHHHRAIDDATCTALIFKRFLEMLKEQNIADLEELNEKTKPDKDAIKKMHAYHCIILAKNDLGRINLYKLVSESHCNYFQNRPKMPKSLINECREGLIIGSACEAGELYQAILNGSDESEIRRIQEFYDYLEIQPNGNNAFMLREPDKFPVATEEDLRDINRKIVALADEYHKPCVATCDVHFLNPEDEVYRRIIMAGKGFSDADQQAPLYLHTTEEMLEEFSYLGAEKAKEVVITNTNLIADMVERIAPVRPDKCPPVIENSDETLREICYNKAHEMYGPELPPVVEERLERELKSIIGNGYAVMYIIAQKLVWKSNEDGYLVGSRGSVGSSFVATMAGITEVNPLSAHYLCDSCHYVDFDSDFVKSFSGRGGCDMPDKDCPVCGKKLTKQGFDIPFETFLGFKGDKEPDIDLNFSGDYQSKAHRYTEVIFGEGQTFKAGTVSTVADKNAFGYVKKYFEERGVHKRGQEIDRLAIGCTGVKSTTGQHPGGIIVLPVGEDIYSFTPVQHPANKDTDIVTTHFDYHSIDQNLLKLDILGHQDPTMIRKLQDLIGIDPVTIPLDDKAVMSLFQSTEALGITPDDIMGTKTGTLGIPEFGTDFAIQMLLDAKPTEFTDLVRIAGLAHGTDVWLGNAKDLILAGTATISTAICTRDDIMTYLIARGVEPEESFKIMEAVRKGTVAKGKCDKWEQYKADMRACDVPEWYIESCQKIKYMFPKAHAVAYVMMAWRVAYCKINYPLEYYAAYFSIRADGFDYELMCQGKARCELAIAELKKKENKSATDDNVLRDLRLVQEMYARGFEFLPIDLYKSDARYFQVVDGKLLPPFNVVAHLGDKAAELLQIAAKTAPFLSIDDIKERGKIPQTAIDVLQEMGVLKGLPQSNQMSIFDLM